MPFSILSSLLPLFLTLAVAAAGGFLASAMGMPAGWLMGSALAVTVAALGGLPIRLPDGLRNVIFILIGMSMGATVSPDSLSMLASWPISLAALAMELVIIIAATGWMLTRFFNLDAGTAYLSSFPGHLSFVMGIAATGVGDARQIVIIQVMRILMLTIAVPIGATILPVEHFAVQEATAFLDPLQILVLFLACALAGVVFMALKVPAGMVLGAMAAATVSRLGGLYVEVLPIPLVTITFVLTGAMIGSRFVGISRREFLAAAKGGVIATAMTVGIVTLVALVVAQLVDIPFGQLWLGLSPGAIEGMGALGIALGYDTAFIASHHVIRLLMLSVAIPVVVVIIQSHERRRAQQRHN